MKIQFFSFLLIVIFLTGCSERNEPPASFSYGTGSSINKKTVQKVIVQKGETLDTLAMRYGTSKQDIIKKNNLPAPYKLWPGQLLYITPSQNKTFVVPNQNPEKKDLTSKEEWKDIEAQPLITLDKQSSDLGKAKQKTLQEKTKTAPDSLPKKDSNKAPEKPSKQQAKQPADIEKSLSEKEDEILEELAKIKNKTRSTKEKTAAVKAPPADTALPTPLKEEPLKEPLDEPSTEEKNVPEKDEKPSPSLVEQEKEELPSSRAEVSFSWPLPVKGDITLQFGQKGATSKNDGINIAAPLGTPVFAVENGSVVYSGNELKGFGNLVLLRHQNGWMSAYGHLSKIFVKQGERVDKGQKIATLGQTGQVSSPQLHLEIRQGTKAVDPLSMVVTP